MGNFQKKCTLDEDSHVVFLIPLREYLNKFQGFLDSLKNTPLEPTEIERPIPYLLGLTQYDIKSLYSILVSKPLTPSTTT